MFVVIILILNSAVKYTVKAVVSSRKCLSKDFKLTKYFWKEEETICFLLLRKTLVLQSQECTVNRDFPVFWETSEKKKIGVILYIFSSPSTSIGWLLILAHIGGNEIDEYSLLSVARRSNHRSSRSQLRADVPQIDISTVVCRNICRDLIDGYPSTCTLVGIFIIL